MQQLLTVWQALDARRRAIVLGATAAVFAAVLALSAIASKPSMALLYAGLAGPESGEVVGALEQRGAKFEVRGDSIYVEAAQRDALRMTLAAEGLPATGNAGYELLDTLSGFGTTSQMFDAAYWRAKEGELARTILSNPAIRAARVHISAAPARSFRTDLRPTASVSISTAAGGLSAPQAKALKFLVASAVAGMHPDDVSIIDSEKGLIGAPEANTLPQGEERAEELRRNVERLLEARVGYGNAIVEVAVETVTDREAITERVIDPAARVAISTDLEERSKNADDVKPGAVTIASNLPEGDAGGSGKSQSSSSETRERTNYEVSETTREILRTPGALKRLSVAVLVDGMRVTSATGETQWQPRSEQELADLHELVASAVGFNEARGDVITIRSLEFEPVAMLGSEAQAGLLAGVQLDLMQIIQIALLALVAVVLGLFVMRPILTQAPYPAAPALAAPSPDTPPALAGEIAEGNLPEQDMQIVSDFGLDQLPMPMASAFDDDFSTEDPVARIKRLIDERQAETIEILRSWMEDEEETA
ncbi:flagellar basal-body MS-ring/collar protein FliF [Pseudothioclava arenosa]|uniref:Flagellar M-ring protein n=1 Tax=Pseudothioclava arenosa TaxID=1795308 RepID=A0A2A4CKZ0_9RHOB|nr:flagellar basal-body MS-ring/collar protein FliF [Pseudothioclava arenosa]PCD75941.1 flagellar M-ring protein FliF [Pseudothioclava arenosa]